MPDGHGQNGCHKDDDCDPGYECVDGECVPIRCDNGTCPPTHSCYNGVCYEKCNDGICPPGYECVIPEGETQPICMPIGGGGEGGGNDLDDIYLGYYPGCRVANSGPVNLLYGDGVPSGDKIKSTDAVGIITSFAVAGDDFDPETGEGNWTCIFTNTASQIKTVTEYGTSPLEGYYVNDPRDPNNCKDSEPDQPGGNPERVDTDPIGCIQSEPGSMLKWVRNLMW